MELRKLFFAGLFAVAPLTTLGCSAEVGSSEADDEAVESTEEADSISSTSTFYIVTRQDYRRCMWPMCGGVYVKRVNQTMTKCADGKYAKECYVADFDFKATKLPETDQGNFRNLFRDGKGLVRGKIELRKQNDFDVATIVGTEAWAGNAQAALPKGTFYRVIDRGLRCVTHPCPQYHEAKLNSAVHANIAGIDLGASGVKDPSAGYAAATETNGVLVVGTHRAVSGPAGRSKELVASEFYTLVKASEGAMCGGIAGFACPADQVCDVTIQNACGGADLSGTCIRKPEFCQEIWRPVCGCDGKTYGNDCERQTAGIQLDHEGACN